MRLRFRVRKKKNSDTGNRTPSCRVRGGNVSRYTISDLDISISKIRLITRFSSLWVHKNGEKDTPDTTDKHYKCHNGLEYWFNLRESPVPPRGHQPNGRRNKQEGGSRNWWWVKCRLIHPSLESDDSLVSACGFPNPGKRTFHVAFSDISFLTWKITKTEVRWW